MVSPTRLLPSRQLAAEFKAHRLVGAENYDPCHPVFQLANISRPSPLPECLEHVRTETWNWAVKGTSKFLKQVLAKSWDVVLPLAQWEQTYPMLNETSQQFPQEGLVPQSRLQICTRGAYQAPTHGQGLPAVNTPVMPSL